MRPLRLKSLALVVAGAASVFASLSATEAAASGRPCATTAECEGAYRPASARYQFAPPAPAYAYAERGHATGYDRSGGGRVVYEGPVYAERAQEYAPGGYAGEAYAQGGYAHGAYPAPPRSPCSDCGPPPPPPPCVGTCVPAYAFAPPRPPEEVRLISDFYTGGVGITDVGGGGGGGYSNGNFEVSGFGDVSAFTSTKAVAWANADAYAKSIAYANATAKANASANAQANVNISLKGGFFGGYKGGYGHGYKGGGCDTCGSKPPQPVACNTCGGAGYGGKMGGWAGGYGKGWGGGMAPSPRGGCSSCGGGKRH